MTTPEYRALLLLLMAVFERVEQRESRNFGELSARDLLTMIRAEMLEEYKRIGGLV